MEFEMNFLVAYNDGNEMCFDRTFADFETAVAYARKKMSVDNDNYYNVLIIDDDMRRELSLSTNN